MNNFILKNENAIFYECGFSCDNVIYIKIDNASFFITDSRYTTEAKEFVKNTFVIDGGFDLHKKAREILKKYKVKKIIFDPLNWSIDNFKKISSKSSCYFLPKINFSQKKRIVKTKEEIKIIKKAVKLGSKGFEKFANFLEKYGENLSEKELFFKASEILTQKGKLKLSFNPIIAINENSAKPHSVATNKKIKDKSLILFDAGIKYKGYCSDRTRVLEWQKNKKLNFSKKQIFQDKQKEKIYNIVLKAQEKAINFAKPGVKTKDIDKVAREVIEKAGFGKYFIHSTGHGVGLDIHELPFVSKRDDTILKEGMVFTIEPGIYIPKNFGIRIEDMLLVTSTNVEIL